MIFDYAVTLQTEEGAVLRVEQPFALRRHDEDVATVDPERAADHAPLLVGLLHKIVEGAEATEAGELTVRLSDAWALVVPPHSDYEAWTFAGSRGEHVVCVPGGGVTAWGADPAR